MYDIESETPFHIASNNIGIGGGNVNVNNQNNNNNLQSHFADDEHTLERWLNFNQNMMEVGGNLGSMINGQNNLMSLSSMSGGPLGHEPMNMNMNTSPFPSESIAMMDEVHNNLNSYLHKVKFDEMNNNNMNSSLNNNSNMNNNNMIFVTSGNYKSGNQHQENNIIHSNLNNPIMGNTNLPSGIHNHQNHANNNNNIPSLMSVSKINNNNSVIGSPPHLMKNVHPLPIQDMIPKDRNPKFDSDKAPKIDNSIFRQMHCDYNCLMTNHMKKLKAFNLHGTAGTKNFELIINANEVGPTNFGETFPRSLGVGHFDEKGNFSIPFVQQTTSNNKKKGTPTLMFQLEFRESGYLDNPIVFSSEWFFTVCQNTRAKKRYRVHSDNHESVSSDVPNMVANMNHHTLSQVNNKANLNIPKFEPGLDKLNNGVGVGAGGVGNLNTLQSQQVNMNGVNSQNIANQPRDPLNIIVKSIDTKKALGIVKVALGTNLESVRSIIEKYLGEFIGQSKDFRFVHNVQEFSRGGSTTPVLVSKVQEQFEIVDDFVNSRDDPSPAIESNGTSNPSLYVKISDINSINSLAPPTTLPTTNSKGSIGSLGLSGSSNSSLMNLQNLKFPTPTSTSSGPNNWILKLNPEQLYSTFGVGSYDMVTPEKLSRCAKLFPGDSARQSLQFFEEKVFGSKIFETWFLGFCSRVDAEGYLSSQRKKTFILRFSSDQKGKGIALSIRGERDTVHGTLSQRDTTKGDFVWVYAKMFMTPTLQGQPTQPPPKQQESEYKTLKQFVESELIPNGFIPYRGHPEKTYANNDIIDKLCNDFGASM